MANEISKIKLPNNVTYNITVDGLGAAAYKGTTTSVTSGSSDLVTSGAVYTAIDNLPEPMVFKGSLGTGGTITTLPVDGTAQVGDTYKVITAGTYDGKAAKVGDTFICLTKTASANTWELIPSGDEPSGTVTSITLKATSPIAIDSSSAITTSGTRTLSHANSGVTAGTYRSVTVNATGHVTAGTNPTTLSGYGITDAKIANGVITLGSNTITPLTSHQTVTDNNPTLAWGTKSKVATIGSTEINVTMPSNPNTDKNVQVNNTNPSSGTWYYPVWYTATSGTGQLNANDGFRYYVIQGTASAVGKSILSIGNYTASGTANNKFGELRICSQNVGYSALRMTSGATVERVHTLPDVAGTVSVFTATPTSGKVIVSDGTAGGIKTSSYTLSATVNSGATGKLAYYSGANAVSASDALYFVTAESSASTPATRNILGVYGQTYGNTAATMISGTAGLFSYGDGGPQLVFNASPTGGQAGALIYTDNDIAATGVSWHFVSNQSDWNVTSKRFHARTSMSIGTDLPTTGYNLYVNGTTLMTNQLVIQGSAASKPLKVRGIIGTDGGDGTAENVLYLQYGNTTTDTVTFGNTGGGSISSNGTQYSGNAATATKLATARSIALGSDLQGSANFDGSGNITINAVQYYCSVSGGNKANYPWHRIAYVTNVNTTTTDKEAILVIRRKYDSGSFGIIKISLRTNASGAACTISARWIVRYGFAEDDVVIAHWGVTGDAVYADVFLKCGTYPRTFVYQLYGGRVWTLVDSNEVNDTTTTDKKTSTEVYKDVATAATEIHNQAYTSTSSSVDSGSVNYAKSAGTLDYFTNSRATNIGLTVDRNAIGYVSGLTSDLWNYNRTDGCLYTQRYNDKYQHEIFGDYRTGRMSVRGNNNGTWQDWKRVIVDEVLSNEDLNDIKIPGFYRAGGSNTVTNVPSTAGLAFGLLVIQSALGQYCYQLYNQAGTNNTWRRSCSNGTWSAWVAENINNTNTTYTIGTNGNNITLTPSSGSVQSITAPYATSAGSATKATQDGSGNTITSTYVKKSGDTMTGTLTLYREDTTVNNVGTELKFSNKDTTTGKGYADAFIRLYDGGENGGTFVIKPGGNLFIGSGEAASSHYALYTHNTSENFYATSDSNMFLQSNGGTIANRVGMGLFTDHTIRPIKADVSTNNVGSIGTSSYRWNEIYGRSIYSTRENQLITGSGTAAQDKGEGVSPRYFPAKWTFNAGLTIAEGDTFTIKLPVIGHDYGTYLSLDNGTTYYPVIYNGTSRFGGQFPANSHITVIYDPNGSATSVYPLAGGNDRVTVTGGAFRVLNLYDANNNVTVANTNPTTGTWYYPVWYTATSGTGQVRANDGFRHYSLQGTASAAGRSIIQVGNATQTGTAGNKYGEFRIYSQKQGYSTLTMASGATAERKHTLPDVAGTIGVFTATPTSGQVVVSDGTAGGFKTTGYTIAKSVPSNAVFTDTNNEVTQTNTTDSNAYRVLLSLNANDTTETKGARKSGNLTFNPSTSILQITDSEGNYTQIDSDSIQLLDYGSLANTSIRPAGITTQTLDVTNINSVAVGSSPKFTDGNLTQTKTTTNATYDILFSYSTTNTDTKTEGGRKSPKLSYNPSTGQLKNQGTYSACNSSGVETSYLNTRVLCLNTNKSTSDDYYMEFRYGSNAGSYYTRLRASNVSGNRNVYLPTTDGTIAVASSDIRLKENIMATEVPNATSIINQIQLHSFDWKSEREPNDRHWKIGVIADELEELDPRFTLPGSGGYNMDGSINAKTVDTFYLMGYLIKTIQELSAEIKELEEKIK